MKIKIITIIAMASLVSTGNIYADENMDQMNMMDKKFNMQMEEAKGTAMKMEKEKNMDKKQKYLHSHMENMKSMMGMMDGMATAGMKQESMPMNTSDCKGMQGQGMMGNKAAMVNDGQGQGGMMMGSMMQMMGGMMGRNDMMEKRMVMMQGMMEQMLKHMDQQSVK